MKALRYKILLLSALWGCQSAQDVSWVSAQSLTAAVPNITKAIRPAGLSVPIATFSASKEERPTPGGAAEVETKGMPPLSLGLFAFVIESDGYRVVLREEVEERWAASAPKTLNDVEPLAAEREVKLSSLPPELASWSHQKVKLFGASGMLCEATVTKLSLVGRVGLAWFDDKGLAPGSEAYARNVWKQSQENGQQLLVATLDVLPKNCAGASWARLAALPSPSMVEAVPVSGVFAEDALKSFRQLPAYKKVQGEYEAQMSAMGEYKEKSRWDELDGGHPEVYVMRTGAGPTLAWVSAQTGVYDCDGPMYRLEAIFIASNDLHQPRFTLVGVLSKDAMLGFTGPYTAVDLDNDNTWEFIAEGQLVHKLGKMYQDWAYLEDPSEPPEGYCL